MLLVACVVFSQDFWELVCTLLLHKHSWIRLVSCRLLGLYYDSCGQTNHKKSNSKVSFERIVYFYVMFNLGNMCVTVCVCTHAHARAWTFMIKQYESHLLWCSTCCLSYNLAGSWFVQMSVGSFYSDFLETMHSWYSAICNVQN